MSCARTAVGGSVGRWQVGTSLPGLGLEALLAALAVLASGVVLTLALEVTVLQQALGGMEVTLAPERRRQKGCELEKIRVHLGRKEESYLNWSDKASLQIL